MTDPSSDEAAIAGANRLADAKRLFALIGPIISVVMLCIALWFLHRELAGLSGKEILEHIRTIPPIILTASLVFAACSYLTMTGYDSAALRYIKKEIPYRRTALTSFTAYAVGHNVGFVAISGGSIRYRMYTLAGLSAVDIAQIIVFVTLTFALGASGLLGLALLVAPTTDTGFLGLPSTLLTTVGTLLVLFPVIYAAASFRYRGPFTYRSFRVALPPPKLALSQVVLSAVDLIFASATLYVLLAPSIEIGFLTFLGIYLLAMFAGLISSVPGGIGVFEAVLVVALPQIGSAALLGTILVYRLIYYVLPLALAFAILVIHEARQHSAVLLRSAGAARSWLSGIAPQAIATAVFLAGVVLLISGELPAVESRLKLIEKGIPLPILELSHLAGSLTGVGLLILARGLYRRFHGAYRAALFALLFGISVSLLKGLDYEEALILGCISLLLWFSRNEFYRTGSLGLQRFSAQWLGPIAIVLCISTWIGFVSYRHVDYSHELWWQFAFDAQAPRIFRASVLAAVAALAFALWNGMRSGLGDSLPDLVPDTAELRRVLLSSSHSSSNLALVGDKRFLWSPDRKAFIMYQVCGNSWVAMGDPVGSADQYADLAWAFLELADRFDGHVVFYEVSGEYLSLYIDLGLSLAKIGEDARVSLEGFSLQGSQRAELRQAVNRGRKNGSVFEVVPCSDVSSIVADLRRVSDRWLEEKSTIEKGFSLGSFSESYILNFDCAVVRVNNEIVAFANLWTAPAGDEMSIDLMRYDQTAPKGIMDFLFAELMMWGTANSYKWFSLGMAPLSGLENRALAPLWHKLGRLIFTHGESFYNFEGLRKYKEKFDPEWEARYLACPDGWTSVPLALFDVSRLISGGVSRILVK